MTHRSFILINYLAVSSFYSSIRQFLILILRICGHPKAEVERNKGNALAMRNKCFITSDRFRIREIWALYEFAMDNLCAGADADAAPCIVQVHVPYMHFTRMQWRMCVHHCLFHVLTFVNRNIKQLQHDCDRLRNFGKNVGLRKVLDLNNWHFLFLSIDQDRCSMLFNLDLWHQKLF